MKRLIAVVAVSLFVGCGEPEQPEKDGDASLTMQPDAGTPQDSGATQDAGQAQDAGISQDAGQAQDAGVSQGPRTVLDVPVNEAKRYIYDYGGDRKNEKWTFDLAKQVAMPVSVVDVYIDIDVCTDVGKTAVILRADAAQEEFRILAERRCEDTPNAHEARWIHTPTRTLQARVDSSTYFRPAGAMITVKVLGWIVP